MNQFLRVITVANVETRCFASLKEKLLAKRPAPALSTTQLFKSFKLLKRSPPSIQIQFMNCIYAREHRSRKCSAGHLCVQLTAVSKVNASCKVFNFACTNNREAGILASNFSKTKSGYNSHLIQ